MKKEKGNWKPLKILSLFDWMSCGQQAITNLWITEYEYYSSEIDKFAIKVTQENFPNTIQIWDVTQIQIQTYGKWSLWEYKVLKNYSRDSNGLKCYNDYNIDIDILLWWSPCQWFSFAWKQLNFQDPRSALFFEYVRILKEVKPKYFLLENVKMKKEYQDVISEHLFWIQPILLDSVRLTAQNRKRLYWVWKLQEDWTYKRVEIEQPKDKGILLKDILEDEVDEKYYLSNEQICKIEWSNFMQEKLRIQKWDKCWTLLARDYKNPKCAILYNKFNDRVMLEKCWTLWTWSWFTNKQGYQVIEWEHKIRKLTPLEYERLQWVKDNYTSCVSNSQRYKMLGNWWTIPIIEHILKSILTSE